MQDVNWVALTIFVLLFAFITWWGSRPRAGAGRSRFAARVGLGGRRFGTVITWFLVGGDVYTAYTFIAVPALAFGAARWRFRGALHHRHLSHPVPGVSAPLVCVSQARLHHGRRFRARTLRQSLAGAGDNHHRHRRDDALHRLQLVGIQVVVGALGISGTGLAADLPLIIAFAVLAAFTYSSGLRAPASIAIVKDILIYVTAFAAVIVIPIELGGFGKIFAAVPPQKLLLAVPGPHTTGTYGSYATLALGSALALFLYPHTLTAIMSASSGRAIRRNAPCCPATPSCWACSPCSASSRSPPGSRSFRNSQPASSSSATTSQCRRCCSTVPVLVRRYRVRGDWYRRPGAGGHHVDRCGESLHAQHSPRVHQQESDRRQEAQMAKWVSLIVKLGRSFSSCSCRQSMRLSCNCWAGSGSSRRYPP